MLTVIGARQTWTSTVRTAQGKFSQYIRPNRFAFALQCGGCGLLLAQCSSDNMTMNRTVHRSKNFFAGATWFPCGGRTLDRTPVFAMWLTPSCKMESCWLTIAYAERLPCGWLGWRLAGPWLGCFRRLAQKGR